MDFSLTENQLMIRDSVRKYAEAELLPNYQRWDRTGEFLSKDFIDKLVNMGLLRLRLPEKYDGQGYSFVDCGIVCEEIGRCDHQIRYIISNAIHLGEMAASMHPELQDEWIPRTALVVMLPASAPPRGSVNASDIISPLAMRGIHSSCKSGCIDAAISPK